MHLVLQRYRRDRHLVPHPHHLDIFYLLRRCVFMILSIFVLSNVFIMY